MMVIILVQDQPNVKELDAKTAVYRYDTPLFD